MRKLLAACVLIIVILAVGALFLARQKQSILSPILLNRPPTPTPTITQEAVQTTLFVPYWSLSQAVPDTYTHLVYFGITANDKGVDTKEDGFINLQRFVQKTTTSSSDKLLTLRLLDQTTNETILNDASLQSRIIDQTLSIVTQYGFSGVVLDFEYKALPFDSVLKAVTDFSTRFAQKSKEKNIKFYQAIYGDMFYRSRPFDIASLGKITNGIFVMSYDLHKAQGDPGPNFPLFGNDYTFGQMTSDFLVQVPASKLTIIFGMYGYDWQIDSKGQSIGQASSLSILDIQKQFSLCSENCQRKKDSSGATKITYTKNGNSHIIWFDEMDTISKKIAFLKTKGIFSIAYWANSYF